MKIALTAAACLAALWIVWHVTYYAVAGFIILTLAEKCL